MHDSHNAFLSAPSAPPLLKIPHSPVPNNYPLDRSSTEHPSLQHTPSQPQIIPPHHTPPNFIIPHPNPPHAISTHLTHFTSPTSPYHPIKPTTPTSPHHTHLPHIPHITPTSPTSPISHPPPPYHPITATSPHIIPSHLTSPPCHPITPPTSAPVPLPGPVVSEESKGCNVTGVPSTVPSGQAWFTSTVSTAGTGAAAGVA